MDCCEAFRRMEFAFRNGGEIPLPEEKLEDELPLEEQLSIQSISGLTAFMRGVPEEIANEIEKEEGLE